MTQFKFTIGINCPPEKVFSLIDQPSDYPKWQAGVTAGGNDPDDPASPFGTGWQVRKVFGKERKMSFVITQYEPNRLKAYKSTSGPTHVEGVYLVESENGGTRFTVHFSSEIQGSLKLAAPLINRTIAKQWESSLQNLKHLLESTDES